MLPEFTARNATIWGISADPLEESQKLAQKLHLSYPLAVDPDLAAIRKFGVQMKDSQIAVPATYVLRAGDGQVVYRHIGESVFDRPAAAAILSALDAAKAPSR